MDEQFTVTPTTETAWKGTSESIETVIPDGVKLESNEDATSFVTRTSVAGTPGNEEVRGIAGAHREDRRHRRPGGG